MAKKNHKLNILWEHCDYDIYNVGKIGIVK